MPRKKSDTQGKFTRYPLDIIFTVSGKKGMKKKLTQFDEIKVETQASERS